MSKTDYIKADMKLKRRKEELFNIKDITKWEMTQEDLEMLDKNELLNDKEYAFSKMLVKV